MDRPLSHRLLLAVLLGAALLSAGCVNRALRPVFSGVDAERPQIGVRLKAIEVDGEPLRTGVPTEIRFLPTGTNKASRVLVVAEKRGTLRWIDLRRGTTGFLVQIPNVGIDIEQGLLGFDFHPRYPAVPELFTHHQDAEGFGGRTVITRWTLSGDSPEAMTAEGTEVLSFDQPQGGHNGGQLAFGPDGYLYVGFGDGGWQGDPGDRAQDTDNLFGTLIRLDIDVPGVSYSIPPDNPFVKGEARREIWAYGFRNPWRFDFGPDGALVLADLGQDRQEEINLVEPGGNYGWSLKEGTLCFGGPRRQRRGSCEDSALVDPIHSYRRAEGRAIIGGKFYTGSAIEELDGAWVFADYTSGRMWAMRLVNGAAEVLALGGFGIAPTAFGRDDAGEIYVGVQGGRLYKLVPGG